MSISLVNRYGRRDDDGYNDSVYVIIFYHTITHVVSLVDRYELIELFFAYLKAKKNLIKVSSCEANAIHNSRKC